MPSLCHGDDWDTNMIMYELYCTIPGASLWGTNRIGNKNYDW